MSGGFASRPGPAGSGRYLLAVPVGRAAVGVVMAGGMAFAGHPAAAGEEAAIAPEPASAWWRTAGPKSPDAAADPQLAAGDSSQAERPVDATQVGFFPVSPSRLRLRFDAGAQMFEDIPEVGSQAVKFVGGQPRPIGESDNFEFGPRVGFGLGYGLDAGDATLFGSAVEGYELFARFNYANAESNSSSRVPVGTLTVGNVYIRDFNSSFGINAGATGGRTEQRIEVDRYETRLGGEIEVELNEDTSYVWGTSVNYRRTDFNHWNSFQSPTFPNFNSETDHDLEQHDIGGEINGRAVRYFTPRFSGFLGWRLEGKHISADLDTTQSNRAPVAGPESNFQIMTSDDADLWSFEAGGSIGIYYDATPQTRFYAGAEANYINDTMKIDERTDGPDRSPHFDTEATWEGRLTLGVRYSF